MSKIYSFCFILLVTVILSFVGNMTQATGPKLPIKIWQTQTLPGFALVRFDTSGLTNGELLKEPVFIDNTEDAWQRHRLKPLIKYIEAQGFQVIRPEEVRKFLLLKAQTLISLGGEEVEGVLHFPLRKNRDKVADFEAFMTENFAPKLVKDFQINFGGNFSQFHTNTPGNLTTKTYFIGRVNQERPTMMKIHGKFRGVNFQQIHRLPFDKNQAHNSELPLLWKAHESLKNQSSWTLWERLVLHSFPLLLIIIGLILIVLGGRHCKKKTQLLKQKDFFNEEFLKQPIEESQSYQIWEESIPFEIEARQRPK